MSNEFIGFITPQFELLQLSFLIIILVMFFGAIISVHLNAKDASWNRNWNNGTIEDNRDNLDIDHGSVTDLWNAIATKSEKLAEIMPGMLLVVGLLGTFLGLGMALNHASNILGESSALSAAGTANNMQDLMSMMQGLGTKFKTSTWGITFFLLFKVWSSWKGYEEKRLAWVIRKVKKELEQRKIQEQEDTLNKQEKLFAKITQAANSIVNSVSDGIDKIFNNQKSLHVQNSSIFSKEMGALCMNLNDIKNMIRGDNLIIINAVNQGIQGVRDDLVDARTSVQNDNSAIKKSLEKYTQIAHQDLVEVNSIASAIKQVIERNSQESIKKLIDIESIIQTENFATKQALDKNMQDVREDLSSIKIATQSSGDAMVDFVSSTQDIIKDMSIASGKMADGAHKIGVAGGSLVNAVNDFSTQFTKVLGEVRTDLSSAINEMSEQAAQTLEQGTAELGKATLEISAALGVLSKDVTATMGDVKNSIEKSLQIQEKGAVLFRNSSDSLNENVAATTELVKKLEENISSGLSAVSNSGRQMISIGKSLEAIVPEMGGLIPALEPLKTLHTSNHSLIAEAQGLRAHFELTLKNKKETSAIIRASADDLNKGVASTTASINKLSRDILDGFQAASESSSKIASIEDLIKKSLTEIHGLRKDILLMPKVDLSKNRNATNK